MTFIEFLDIQYRNNLIKVQANYGLYTQAEMLASGSLLKLARAFIHKFAALKLLGQFVLMKLHILQPPQAIAAEKKDVPSIQQQGV